MDVTNAIDTNGGSIICTGTNIGISDDRLVNILSRTYETARRDATKFSFFGCYNILFSIAGTLLITLLTSEFKSIGSVSAENVTIAVWIIFSICLIGGMIMVSIHFGQKGAGMIEERDKAVMKEINAIKIVETHS